MNRRTRWGMAAGLAVCMTAIGCANAGHTIRAQSPSSAQPAAPAEAPLGPFIGSAPGYAEHATSHHKDFKTLPHFHDSNFGFEGGYYAGPEGYYTYPRNYAYTYGDNAGGCPYCQNGTACPPDGCPDCGHGCPHHHMTYQYKWPENLVYPAPVMPAGMIQWPYYTLRGPTDFFMK